ncbi:MAG TPA: ion channel [Polyangia bacterium]|nr:ion channel [Polyangia bacterium]
MERALHKDVYHFILARGWPSFFALVAVTFLTANVLFASLYLAQPGCIAHARPGSFEDAFYFSVQTIATIGYGGMYPLTRFAHIVVVVEAMTGMLGIAVITGLTFTRFARPSARVLFANKVTVTPRDVVPHLMFRMANWRRNRVVETHLRVVLLVTERTREGETLRRQIDVPLVRDRTAVFFLTWTAMHKIDADSPFHGPDPLAKLGEKNAALFLSLMGFDETIGQTIIARHEYALSDIVYGARFADVLGNDARGRFQIDFRKFHDVVPVAPATGE